MVLASGVRPDSLAAEPDFSGKERDAETGLDYFGARYMSSAQGRFTSPDPLNWLPWQQSDGPSFKTATDLALARDGKIGNRVDFRERLSDPQSLNLYAYVRNNPLRFVDPFGLEENSPENLKKREAMDQNARRHEGSTAWAVSKKKDDMPAGSWKCSKFVNDVATESGAPATFGDRAPVAGEWRNPNAKIEDWRPLKAGETPMPGDVAAIKIADPGVGATGHAGVVVSDGRGGATVMQAHEKVVSTDGAGNFNKANAVTYRRYTGD
jgi:RHS repeat-associated protein